MNFLNKEVIPLNENRIKELREYLEMNQLEFSLYLGIPVRTLQNWENGYRQPTDYVVQLIETKIKYDNLVRSFCDVLNEKF